MKCTTLFVMASFFMYIPFLEGQEVRHAGAMRRVMTGVSLENNLLWDTLSSHQLYGIGPLDRLTGEVTVVDGIIYIAKVNEVGEVVTTPVQSAAAPFGVYINLGDQVSVRAHEDLNNLDSIERLIITKAREAGLNTETPFMFIVKGKFDWIKLHVLDKPADEQEHNHELHDKAKKYVEYTDISGELIGFYSLHHEGVFTHRGSYTHIHFISRDKAIMGHLDGIRASATVDILFSRN
jgi:acetolactate decarboxylase